MLRPVFLSIALTIALPALVAAEEDRLGEESRLVPVRRLDSTRLFHDDNNTMAVLCEGSRRDKPRVFPDAMALAEVVKDKEIRDRIAAQIDFGKEQLILIAWKGGSNNKPHRVDVSDDGESVVFVQPPITFQISKGDRHHVYLYALPKTAKWSHRKEPTRK